MVCPLISLVLGFQLIFFFWIFSFFFQSERGLFPNTEFVFDIELPIDFVPKNNDGEVDEFKLVPANKLVEQICDSDMKTTSCPVTLDFLIRKGIVNAETGNRPIVFYKFLMNKMRKWRGFWIGIMLLKLFYMI